ncbi:MAG: diaminopimelate decarboxylase, partial [Thermomicrobiales bacterium]
ITLHGNNKSRSELEMALEAQVGYIAIDNTLEIEMLADLTSNSDTPQKVLIRVNPGIDVQTHGKIATGVVDSKFGFPIWTDAAACAVEQVLAIPGLELVGYHCHLGSQLFDVETPVTAVRKMLAFAGEMNQRHGYAPPVISPGGGMGIAYTESSVSVSVSNWISRTVSEVNQFSRQIGIAPPRVIFEPGRLLVGQAGVALYEVGARKEIRGVRTYVSVDGGMADNIRPSLYDATYTAELANRHPDGPMERVTISGKFCESGDVLINEIDLPLLMPGDLLAVPAAGAYCIPLASNYNMALRPAVILVENQKASLIRRRETFEDLMLTFRP